jgi:hypothetical protein
MSICRIAVLAAALFANAASAQVAPFPPGMSARMVETNGTTLHVRTGGAGPAVVLLHGYGKPATCGARSQLTLPPLTP